MMIRANPKLWMASIACCLLLFISCASPPHGIVRAIRGTATVRHAHDRRAKRTFIAQKLGRDDQIDLDEASNASIQFGETNTLIHVYEGTSLRVNAVPTKEDPVFQVEILHGKIFILNTNQPGPFKMFFATRSKRYELTAPFGGAFINSDGTSICVAGELTVSSLNASEHKVRIQSGEKYDGNAVTRISDAQRSDLQDMHRWLNRYLNYNWKPLMVVPN